MKAPSEVIAALNDILGRELVAINQYILHARILQNWGLDHIGNFEFHASIDEMKHADELIQRILLLEGLPNVQKLGKISIGQTIEEIIQADLNLEAEAIPALKIAIGVCEKHQDYVSRDLLTSILKSEESHFDYLETQTELIKKMGLPNYTQSQVNPSKMGKDS